MTDAIEESPEVVPPPEPVEPAAPIENRFLFVDVAAQRAKQLRRGSVPRLSEDGGHWDQPFKLERVAMDEVTSGLIHYSLPDDPANPSKAKE